MNETVLVFGVVLGAAAFVLWRFLPANLKARIAPNAGSSCSSGGCGSKDCDGGSCH
ncbi:MAG: hypothetical protein LWW93_03485 [Hyphomicrobiales bacterium]|nr:hypothetical protein [Hyphomicrobiales bacterium]